MKAVTQAAYDILENMEADAAVTGVKTSLRLLTYNIQVGVASTRFHHYVTRSWKHVLPHASSFENLDRIARLISSYDIVAIQEADAGSLRTHFVNQVEYLARQGHFPFWYHQTNRNLGKFAQHSNGLLSKVRAVEVLEHKLPGLIPGRGAMEIRFGQHSAPLIVLQVHLALGRRARMRQFDFVSELVGQYEHVVVMGDFNCQPQSQEMEALMQKTRLCAPATALHTFPSWRPVRNIDHILVTPSLHVSNVQVLHHALSDHLPIALDIALPKGVQLHGA